MTFDEWWDENKHHYPSISKGEAAIIWEASRVNLAIHKAFVKGD